MCLPVCIGIMSESNNLLAFTCVFISFCLSYWYPRAGLDSFSFFSAHPSRKKDSKALTSKISFMCRTSFSSLRGKIRLCDCGK